MLSVQEVATHFGFRPEAVRTRINSGELRAFRVNRSYRCEWPDVWACEEGPAPRPQQPERYQAPLLSKKELAARLRVSVRTVDRWLQGGLPTRNVFGRVRVNPHDAEDWLRLCQGTELPEGWWQ